MYNFINDATNINVVKECVHDTSVGYEVDLRENGDVDGWDEFSGIHTYGSWGGFLFGTMIGSSGYIGRSSVFTPVPAETHYTIRLSMKVVSTNNPTTGRVMWRTINNSSWASDKSYDFEIQADGVWHTYILNVGTEQYWQGDVNDLRIYPMIDGGEGDRFFIKSIKITSTSTFECNNPTCSYYSNYEHPCQGIGTRAHCLAQAKEDNYFTIESNVNDTLVVNINGYGEETITLSSGTNIAGDTLAKDMTSKISKIDIGGYAEAEVTYSETGRFKIYSGTYSSDSSVNVTDGTAREILGFDSSSTSAGSNPATGFEPKSPFKIRSYQLLSLFDGSEESSVRFNPFLYSVEGGRRDWVRNGLGSAQNLMDIDSGEWDVIYDLIDGGNKTIIDFNHPFNASGKIKRIAVIGSILDSDGNERSGCKVKIFRPRKDGTLKAIHSVDVPSRTSGKLYSQSQEYITLDCDLIVNKGDLLGVYNVDVYVGKSLSEDADALYYEVAGEAAGNFDPGDILGDGNAGLFFYGRSDFRQKKLSIEVDLGNRVNIEDVTVKGEAETEILEYNIARCLDIDWQVELFGESHDTGYWDSWNSVWVNYEHLNVAYGLDNLSDGVYIAEDGLAADNYTANDSNGVIPTNPHYFWVNGDEEWVGDLFHVGQYKSNAYVRNFEEDPIALILHFPYNKTNTIFKSSMYFKERDNFRNFAISYYQGPYYPYGDADNPKYTLIPEYTSITIDSLRYYEGMYLYDRVDDYIFQNPCNAKPIISDSEITNYDEFMAAEVVDWNVIEHEWDAVECYGIRVYTDYHNSTKINEIEIFSYIENEGTSVADSTLVRHSKYEDLWTDADIEAESDNSARAYVGDTSRYFIIEIEPITSMKISDIMLTVHSEDVYVGKKGCKYELLPDHSKKGVINEASTIEFKNIYGRIYDLYVDIPAETNYEKGVAFWSKLNNDESITNPQVGPGAYFAQEDDYPLVFREKNCAINCPVYGLKNLAEGKDAYYSVDNGYTSQYFGTVSGSLDISNISTGKYTVLKLPVYSRDRYWKLAWSIPDHPAEIKVNEMLVRRSGSNLSYTPYFETSLGWYNGPLSNSAPALNDGSLTGTFYALADEKQIGFDLGGAVPIDEIVLFHEEPFTTWSKSSGGIDDTTVFYLRGGEVADAGYYDVGLTATGPGVQIDYWDTILGLPTFELDGNDYITAPYHENYHVGEDRAGFECFVKFNSLPAAGESVILMSVYDDTAGTHSTDRAFKFYLQNDGSNYRLRFNINKWGSYWGWWENQNVQDYTWSSVTTGVWYFLSVTKAAGSSLVINNSVVSDYSTGTWDMPNPVGIPLVIGEGLDGKITNVRMVCGEDRFSGGFEELDKPTSVYTYYMTLSLFSSPDNITFGKYVDVDLPSEADGYYDPESTYNSNYNTYVYIDLEKRHDLQIVRSYGDGSPSDFTLTTNTNYSATETADVLAATFDSTYNDARWVRITMLNGDGTTRTVKEIGVYPDLTNYIAPGGGYNHEWNSLGTSITSYSVGENLALGSTVSGSSYYGRNIPSRIVDGILGDSLQEAWLAEDGSNQWLEIDLGAVYSIYRFKMYHGYSTNDTNYRIEDYDISVSISGTSYTTLFDINNNSSFEREHVLSEPVDARYIKIDILDYTNNGDTFLSNGSGYEWFTGPALREVEVNEYYGFQNVDSEEYPVIAINLEEQFPIQDHSLVGIDPEDTSTNWSNADSNFAYSDSVWTDPEKISFSGWGSAPGVLNQWVTIKRDTATNYNGGPDYLKHAKFATTEYPNPCEYSWWWKSNLSTLSNDYSRVINSLRSLKIEYPTSSGVDHVYMIEGDTFGTDENANWRDALSFWLYIDDVNNLDGSYGYFYFGDANSSDYVEYQWDIEFLYSSLQSGWNNMFLRFKSATNISYVVSNDPDELDSRIISNLETKSFGIRFRGTGNELTMNLDTFKIERNRFMDYSKFSQGLYMARDDYLSFPVGEFDMSKGTIEFWLRPDYNPIGVDNFNVLKHRTLFHLANVANDVFGALVSFNGLVVYHGNIGEEVTTLNFDAPYWDIDDLFHIAFVFSNDGSAIDVDGSAVRVYINGFLIGISSQTWEINDAKKFKFLVGGKSIHAVKEAYEASSIDSVISNLKLYNYCKTNFDDSLGNYEIDRESLLHPNNLIQISKNNVTFYNIGDTNLPLVYDGVANGDSVTLYVRSSIPDYMTGDESRTAYISASWFITV